MQLVETGLENDFVQALVVFSLQYILVNHEYWKYKVKNVRWKVTLKVCCILSAAAFYISYMFYFNSETCLRNDKITVMAILTFELLNF